LLLALPTAGGLQRNQVLKAPTGRYGTELLAEKVRIYWQFSGSGAQDDSSPPSMATIGD